MFGGNSNWRGPVWFPVNVLIIRALLQHYQYYGDEFTDRVPHRLGQPDDPVRGGQGDLPTGWSSTFLTDADGRRPVYGGTEMFQTDQHWRDLVLFYEYFHGDNGAGLGASHQTGLDRCGRPTRSSCSASSTPRRCSAIGGRPLARRTAA